MTLLDISIGVLVTTLVFTFAGLWWFERLAYIKGPLKVISWLFMTAIESSGFALSAKGAPKRRQQTEVEAVVKKLTGLEESRLVRMIGHAKEQLAVADGMEIAFVTDCDSCAQLPALRTLQARLEAALAYQSEIMAQLCELDGTVRTISHFVKRREQAEGADAST